MNTKEIKEQINWEQSLYCSKTNCDGMDCPDCKINWLNFQLIQALTAKQKLIDENELLVLNIKQIQEENDTFRSENQELIEALEERYNKVLKKIEDAAEENFGYDPQDIWFDELLIERDKLEQLLNKHKGVK